VRRHPITPFEASSYRRSRFALICLVVLGFTLVLGVGVASASKQVVDFFGSQGPGSMGGEFHYSNGIAINNSGAGPADQGDIYVSDGRNNRVQRFGHDDHGTPADSTDDTYFFISAWGAGVDSTVGGSEYQICPVASNCQAGLDSSVGGAFKSEGKGLRAAAGVAVDDDTGQVYVIDASNLRVNVYTGDGNFLRSFGVDVVASGPGDSGAGYEVCVAADGDVCKAGLPGAGIGQITDRAKGIAVSQPDGNPTSGVVFLADSGNNRINTYGLDGSSPGSFGAGVFAQNRPNPEKVAVDSRGIVYADNRFGPSEIRQTERYDSQNANGGGVGFLAPINADAAGFTVDPDSDGVGPDTDILYLSQNTGSPSFVRQYGPVNAPGLVAPPTAVDDEHGTIFKLSFVTGMAVDKSTGRLLISSLGAGAAGPYGVYVLDNAGPPPTATLDSLSDITSSSVTANATISPNGPPALSYHFEYSLDGANWKSTPTVVLGSQEAPQSVSAVLEPVGGFEPDTPYHVRLVAARPFVAPIITSALTFTTLPAAPIAETTGAPLRTTTTALLGGRVVPRNTATVYHFEYGDQGPCNANPCTSTEAREAGTGEETKLVAERVSGLAPGTTYHYRVVADNGNPGSPVSGADMTVTTRSSEAPLTHGRLAGPVNSDRAWEQVNMPDTGGNPVGSPGLSQIGLDFSGDGNRALFPIAGGTPTSETGSLLSLFFSERTAAGWQVKPITPPRSELCCGTWEFTAATPDLFSLVSANTEYTKGEAGIWRLDLAGQRSKLFEAAPDQAFRGVLGISADGSRQVALLNGPSDPAFPEAAADNLYDVSSGLPRLVSVLPSGGPCLTGIAGANDLFPSQSTHWISADGTRVFFNCGADRALYMRDIAAGTTKLLSGPAISGPVCGGTFLKSIPGAAFFFTQSRIAAEDSSAASCGASESFSGDVYRYDLGDEEFKCVTCVVANGEATVTTNGTNAFVENVSDSIMVDEDGSRIYFTNETRLLPGTPKGGGTYRLDVASGGLAYVGPRAIQAPAITPDGSVFIFDSKDPGLNSLGGQANAGVTQAYRYDDRDRSLICLSCPVDGSAPVGEGKVGGYFGRQTPAVSDDGNTIAFLTPTPLDRADQNTANAEQEPVVGSDVYEWRDGRLLLVTDGLTPSTVGPNQTYPPKVGGVSASGRDIFFFAAAQYTPDALDAYRRLYDARVGGGFEFPKPPPPCPLEVCQGIPKGAPEEKAPGTGSFSGPGNITKSRTSCRKGKVRRKGRCIARKPIRKRHAKHRADHDRRTAR
jgi:hypothetical protein